MKQKLTNEDELDIFLPWARWIMLDYIAKGQSQHIPQHTAMLSLYETLSIHRSI